MHKERVKRSKSYSKVTSFCVVNFCIQIKVTVRTFFLRSVLSFFRSLFPPLPFNLLCLNMYVDCRVCMWVFIPPPFRLAAHPYTRRRGDIHKNCRFVAQNIIMWLLRMNSSFAMVVPALPGQSLIHSVTYTHSLTISLIQENALKLERRATIAYLHIAGCIIAQFRKAHYDMFELRKVN